MAEGAQNGSGWVPSLRQARFLKAARNPLAAKSLSSLCEAAGIGRTTFYVWMRKDPGFRGAWEYQRAQVRDHHAPLVDAALLRRAQKGNVQAMRLYYQLRGDLKPERHEVTGPGGAPLAAQVEHKGEVAVTADVKGEVKLEAGPDLGQLAKVASVLAAAGALVLPSSGASNEGKKPGDAPSGEGSNG